MYVNLCLRSVVKIERIGGLTEGGIGCVEGEKKWVTEKFEITFEGGSKIRIDVKDVYDIEMQKHRPSKVR